MIEMTYCILSVFLKIQFQFGTLLFAFPLLLKPSRGICQTLGKILKCTIFDSLNFSRLLWSPTPERDVSLASERPEKTAEIQATFSMYLLVFDCRKSYFSV